jgi:membrane-associated phospholipid phosphatase
MRFILIFLLVSSNLFGQWDITKRDKRIIGGFGLAAISVYASGGLPNMHSLTGIQGTWVGSDYRPENPVAAQWGLGALALQGIVISGLWYYSPRIEKEPLVWIGVKSFSGTYLLTQLVKSTIGRTRPYAVNQINIDTYDSNRSFWSSTSAISGTALGMIWLLTADEPKSTKSILFRTVGALATAGVMWSRVEAGQHFTSDVLFGATAGLLIGLLSPRMYAIPGGVGVSLGN